MEESKASKVFNIHLLSDEDAKKLNTPTSSEVFEGVVDELLAMVEAVGDEGGWYTNDSIKIEVKVTYEPENK